MQAVVQADVRLCQRRGLFGLDRLQVVLDRVDQLAAAFAGQRGDLEHRALPLVALEEVLHFRRALVLGHHVELVQHQPARLFIQGLVVFLQLVDDGPGLGDRIDRLVERRQVDDMQQQPGALQVAQELVSQARAFGRALDQAGNVGDHERLLMVDAHHTQVGVQRGERIVRHLRARVGDMRDKGRLAGVGHAQQADIGQHLQLQLEHAALARLAVDLLARRAVGAGLEMQVAPAAHAPFGQAHALAVLGQVGDDFAGVHVGDQRAHRHAQGDVFTGGAIAVGAAAVLAVPGHMLLGVAEVDQRIDIAVRHGEHAAAPAAVATIRAAEGHKLFAPERGAAIAAVAGDGFNSGFVDELHDGFSVVDRQIGRWRSLLRQKRKGPASVAGPFVLQRLLSGRRNDADLLLLGRALDGELHVAVDQGEQRVVLAHADVVAGMHAGTALADDDAAGVDGLATKHLHAQTLRFGITAVPRGTAAFFLCHVLLLSLYRITLDRSGNDRFDAQFGVILTMALTLLVVLATAHLEDLHLVVTTLGDNGSLDGSPAHQRRTKLDLVAGAHCEHLVERDFCANVCRYLFYFQFFASSNLVLLAAGFYDRVHCRTSRM
ncbi:membrane hypothetical protein [Cupriavidus taiwanensis]|nr:membrane hypothetical protein [Cupriavidus taiwanensis]